MSGSPSHRSDPTLNPITRRPGPGRGRPRKQPQTPVDGSAPELDPQAQPQAPMGGPGSDMIPDGLPAMSGPAAGLPHPHPHPGTLPLDANADADRDGEGDVLDEPEIKRPRLEDNTDPSLEDEAVLTALAAHNNPGSVDHYGQE